MAAPAVDTNTISNHVSGSGQGEDENSNRKRMSDSNAVLLFNAMAIRISFIGLTTTPGHALVDTGAQDGTVGLWHFQRWMLYQYICFKLKPVFFEVPEVCEVGGVGGAAQVIAIADMPTGIGGVHRLTRWVVQDENPKH